VIEIPLWSPFKDSSRHAIYNASSVAGTFRAQKSIRPGDSRGPRDTRHSGRLEICCFICNKWFDWVSNNLDGL